MAGGSTRLVVDPRTERASSEPADRGDSSDRRGDLRRFRWTAVCAMVVAGAPFLWLLWDGWTGGVHLFRVAYNSDFYDAQARAIMHGHLWVQKSVLDVEAFRHGGHYYTYFGIFPSLIRIPILLVDPSRFGRLTTTSILVAWLLTGLFSATLIWRVRGLVRGPARLGRTEAVGYGIVLAAVTGGTVFPLLASTPWVYHEDLAWSIALTIGALSTLLGVIEHPTRRRVVVLAVLVVAASLNRATTGYACIFGTLLVATWLAVGRTGSRTRRDAWGIGAIALVAFGLGCSVNWLKFGQLVGIPLGAQTITAVNAHRRFFLAHNGGGGFSIGFVPTTLWAYFQPFGIKVQSIFPFVTLPATPPKALAGAVFDQTYRTASVPAAMPLLFLLSCTGVVGVLARLRTSRPARMLGIVLLAAASAFAGALVFGYIAPRFEGDLVPLLAVGAAVGTAYVWNLVERRRAGLRRAVFVSASVLWVFEMCAAFGIGVMPTIHWTPTQTKAFVNAQLKLSNITGHPIDAHVIHGTRLPYYAPAGALFVAGNCSGLYVSTGESYADDPVQQKEHTTWLPVEQASAITHAFHITFRRPEGGEPTGPVPVISSGPYTVSVRLISARYARFAFDGPGTHVIGARVTVHYGETHPVAITLDPTLDVVSVVFDQAGVLSGVLSSNGPVVLHPQEGGPGGPAPVVTVVPAQEHSVRMPLCRSLLHA